ncbi:phospholipid phosphatase 6 isoform X2 [Nilaparvata lugens]|uniref:phospholipid phosphatase 6 isoform X1 n=1 Tax=Nilaparvata lugens TaxID=108931 RepID=UPI000B987A5F|nr:phospholipid phosphatase 6 isoform X1 [Nilaparvata lugens]XP_039281119.1 phospholipid phosphatase 6 isoform X2 [Nilaparvata lugens]
MMGEQKRVPPKSIQKLLKVDAYLTNLFCTLADKFVPLRSLRTHYKVLEVSCHGLVWFGCWLASIWILWQPSLFEMQVNFYLGLIIDVVAVAVLKATVRRARPAVNKDDMFMTLGPDKYGFPSGHVSRAVFITCFFTHLYPLSIIFYPPLLAWSVSVSVSRILLRRHHILDVLAGALLGFLEIGLLSLLWLSKDSSIWLVSYISDEKIEGGEYHV